MKELINCARNGSQIYSPGWSEGIKNTFGTSIVTFLAQNNTQTFYKTVQLKLGQKTLKNNERTVKKHQQNSHKETETTVFRHKQPRTEMISEVEEVGRLQPQRFKH